MSTEAINQNKPNTLSTETNNEQNMSTEAINQNKQKMSTEAINQTNPLNNKKARLARIAQQENMLMKKGYLSSTSSKGKAFTAVVLGVFPKKTIKSAQGKSTSVTAINVMTTQKLTFKVLTKRDDKTVESGEEKVFEVGGTFIISCFGDSLPESAGSTVKIIGAQCKDYHRDDGTTGYGFSCNEARVINGTFNINDFDPKMFFLKTPDDYADKDKVIFPICGTNNVATSLDKDTGIISLVKPSEDTIYEFEKKDGSPKSVALIGEKTGVPVLVSQWDTEQQVDTTVDTRFYSGHLDKLCIRAIPDWKRLANVMVPNLTGTFFGYIDKDRTERLELNQFRNDDEGGMYGLTVKCLSVNWDTPAILHASGFKVSQEFVKDKFGMVAASDYEPLPAFSKADPIVNLSEYTGKMDDFYNNPNTEYIVVADLGLDGEDKGVFDNLSMEEKEKCLKKEVGAPVQVRNAYYNVFALRGRGSKRVRDE